MDCAADACPDCLFPVHGSGVAECGICGAPLREASPGQWVPIVRHRGAQRIRDLEHRIDHVRAGLAGQRPPALTAVAMPLLLLGALEFALARLGTRAQAAGHSDAFFLAVVAAGLVAFAIYMIADGAWNRFRHDRTRRRALARLRSQRNRACRRNTDVHARRRDHDLGTAMGLG